MKAEFVALDKCGEEAEWLRYFLEDIPDWPKHVPAICIHSDNQSAIGRAHNTMYSGLLFFNHFSRPSFTSLSSVFLPLSPAHRSLSALFRTAITGKEEIPSDRVLIRPDREPAITGKKAQVLLSSEFSSTSISPDFVQRSHRPFVVVKLVTDTGVYEKIWNDEIRPTMVSTVARICFIGYGVIAVLRMEIGILFGRDVASGVWAARCGRRHLGGGVGLPGRRF
ncbi:hypothetical protein L484_021905 [Morus notabilis]|uniref:Uncharacterized protein n=1 Tax=Morus notabilis TaxID=981085 RepID=W9SSX5_9ROSA|nr:hypothetical protein L484_021905 [Morus notabilis]